MENIKTKAIVLRRTNYGEADRILSILTPEGQMSVMAKGVRKEKSKLAGGIELFSVSDVLVKKGKGDLGVLASVRLIEFYGELMKDLDAMELAGSILKDASRKADQLGASEYFDLTWQALKEMNEALKNRKNNKLSIVRAWWGLNVARTSGEEVNLHTDVDGEKLNACKKYIWDGVEKALRASERGAIDAGHIKLMRVMVSSPLKLSMNVVGADDFMDEILYIVKYLY